MVAEVYLEARVSGMTTGVSGVTTGVSGNANCILDTISVCVLDLEDSLHE